MARKKKAVLATEREAKELSATIRSIVQAENNWYILGGKLVQARDGSVYQALGYASMGAWMKDEIHCSRAKAHRAMRAVVVLTSLTPEQGAEMPEGNANLLTKLKPADANSEQWINAALHLPLRELGQAIAKFRHDEYGDIQPEKWLNPWPKVPETGVTIAEAAIEVICAAQEIDVETQKEKKAIAFLHFMTVVAQSSPAELAKFMGDQVEELVRLAGAVAPEE
jgi:hypothetical protein